MQKSVLFFSLILLAGCDTEQEEISQPVEVIRSEDDVRAAVERKNYGSSPIRAAQGDGFGLGNDPLGSFGNPPQDVPRTGGSPEAPIAGFNPNGTRVGDRESLLDTAFPPKPAAPSASSRLDREPTSDEILQAMRSHPAALAGGRVNGMTIRGVEKGACNKVGPNQYRCEYKPDLQFSCESELDCLFNALPNGWNTAVFTKVGTTWTFGGSE